LVNRIHPTAVLGEGVELGDDNVIGPFAVIVGPTRIGDGNGVGPHVTIGTSGEDRPRPHPAGWSEALAGDQDIDRHGVRIGDRNKIREYVSVHQGTWRATTIGSGSYYLRNSRDAHDCVIEDGATMASNVVLGGHVHAWAGPNLGIGAVLHQSVRSGPGAMVDMASTPRREVRAFTISSGNPARVTGVNVIGLSRRGVDDATIEALGPWLEGKGELPARGLVDRLPDDFSTLVKESDDRPRTGS
jgi:UDP-N-acetylglucosamine acyltransferase